MEHDEKMVVHCLETVQVYNSKSSWWSQNPAELKCAPGTMHWWLKRCWWSTCIANEAGANFTLLHNAGAKYTGGCTCTGAGEKTPVSLVESSPSFPSLSPLSVHQWSTTTAGALLTSTCTRFANPGKKDKIRYACRNK